MRKIAITGGCGFIGSHVTQELVERGHIPVIIDNQYYPKQRRFDYDYRGFKSHCIDVRDTQSLFEVLKEVDGVIHLAGVLGTPETLSSFGMIKHTTDVNIMGSLNVFEAAKLFNLPCVYIQTGNGKNLSPYPITKDCAAEFALTYNKEFDTRITVIRGLVAYGERQKHFPVKKIFPTFMAQAIKGEPLTINGDGEQRHDFIYARDLAKVLVDGLDNDKHLDKVIDGGSGHVYTVNEVARLVIEATGSKSELLHLEGLKNGNVRMGEPAHDAILSDDSRNLLKEYQHRRIEDVIDQVAYWYKTVYMRYL